MGADVAITYASRAEGAEKNVKELTDKHNVKCKAYKLDVGDWNAVDAFVKQVIKDFGKIDGFVANAGRTADCGILEGGVDKWMEVIQTDLNGKLSCRPSELELTYMQELSTVRRPLVLTSRNAVPDRSSSPPACLDTSPTFHKSRV